MNITTQEVEHCKLKISYTADAEIVELKRKDALKQLKGAAIPGFRPGKATESALKLKFKDRIDEWVKREMLNHAHDDVLFETKMKPIGAPQVDSSNLNGLNFQCELTYLKKPDFKLGQYKGLEVNAPHMETNELEVAAKFMQELREKYSESRPYGDEDFVQDGDKVTLTYTLSNGTSEEGKLYVVGQKLFPEFDENLYGMSASDSRQFDVNINGERVNCSVTVHMGMKKTPHALDESLAQKCGLTSFDELTNTVNTIAKNQFKAEKDLKVSKQVLSMLVDSHNFECPPWLVNMEAQHLAMQEGVLWDHAKDEVKDSFRKRAESNVKFTLILDSIREEEPECTVSDAEAVEGIRQAVYQKGIKNPDDWMKNAIKNGTMHGLVAKFKNDHAMQWLVDNTKVIEV